MDSTSRNFATFIIFSGMHQFTIVPLVPKRASSSFQEQSLHWYTTEVGYIYDAEGGVCYLLKF